MLNDREGENHDAEIDPKIEEEMTKNKSSRHEKKQDLLEHFT